MNIIYIEKEKLYCLKKEKLNEIDLSLFFSRFKYSLVYIEDNNGVLLGYIDHSLNKKRTSKSDFYRFEITLHNDSLPNSIDVLFKQNLGLDAIPIVDSNNCLMGAYVKSVSDELTSSERVMNTIALSVLPCFIEDLKTYLKNIGVSSVYIISTEEDFHEIVHLLSSFVNIHQYFNEKTLDTDALIIDIQYSKTYRDSLSKSINNSIISLEDLLTNVILPICIDYVNKKGAKILFVEGPLKERIYNAEQKWPQLYLGKSLPESIEDKKLLSTFCNDDLSIIEWSKDLSTGILGGDDVCTNGIHLIMSEKLTNAIDETQIKNPSIYIFGPCFSYGACVPMTNRISSYLNNLISGYSIVNNGVKNGRSILNDLLYILNTNIQPGDVLVDINVYSPQISNTISLYAPVYDFNDYFNEHNNDKCQFLDNTFHANSEVNFLAAKYISTLIPTCKKNIQRCYSKNYFQENDILKLIDSKRILGKSLMNSYIEYVKNHKKESTENQIVGSVILTANPLTKGHEHLIHIAKSKCDLLYVFVVEEDSFEFTTSERMNLVRSVTDNTNIIVLSTGKVMTARYTFPEYYQKSHTSKADVAINPMSNLHFYLFGGIIAPILGITKRFVGEEVKGSVTDYYNQKLQSLLPSYGIDVEIIPRLCDSNNSAVSASKVRDIIDRQEFHFLSELLSPKVLKYIIQSRSEHLLHKGRWSSTYRKGDILLKRYNYYEPEAAKREAKASLAASTIGIRTPQHIKTIIDNKTITNMFEFYKLTTIDVMDIFDSQEMLNDITDLLEELQHVKWNTKDDYWYTSLLPEFKDSISRLCVDSHNYFKFIDILRPNTFIHGDFTCDNFALDEKGHLIIYDFQHGCLGPKGWDKAYLASTMFYDKCPLILNKEEMYTAEIIAAIRLGRAIRKEIMADIELRTNLLKTWKERNIW